jgi:hypothetical protein
VVLWAHCTDEHIIRRQRLAKVLHQGTKKGVTSGCRDPLSNGTHRRLDTLLLGDCTANRREHKWLLALLTLDGEEVVQHRNRRAGREVSKLRLPFPMSLLHDGWPDLQLKALPVFCRYVIEYHCCLDLLWPSQTDKLLTSRIDKQDLACGRGNSDEIRAMVDQHDQRGISQAGQAGQECVRGAVIW